MIKISTVSVFLSCLIYLAQLIGSVYDLYTRTVSFENFMQILFGRLK